jgi:hypothetical protein
LLNHSGFEFLIDHGEFEVRRIHVEDGLSLRFPGRQEDFNEGVEIGLLIALMTSGQDSFSRWLSTGNIDQARAIAEMMRYRMVEGAVDGTWTELTFRTGRARPKLRLVHSRAEAGQDVA